MATLNFITLSQFSPYANTQVAYDGSMAGGSAVLNSPSGKFRATDVGKLIIVSGAGPSGLPGGGVATYSLSSTIQSYQSPTQVTLANASPSGAINCGIVWGNDDSPAMQAAINSLTTGQDLHIPAGQYLFATPISRNFGNNPASIRIFGQGIGTRIYVCSKAVGAAAGQTITLNFEMMTNFKIADILFTGCPFSYLDNQWTLRLYNVVRAEVECSFWNITPNSHPTTNTGGAVLSSRSCLILKSSFRGTVGGNVVSNWNWHGFIENGSEFVDYCYIDNRRLSKPGFLPYRPSSFIQILSPAKTVANQGDAWFSQSKIVIRNTRLDEDGGVNILVDAPAGAIREVEIDGVNINAPGEFTGSTGDAGFPAIKISGVQQLKIASTWIGYNKVTPNSTGVTLSNVNTAYLRNVTLAQFETTIAAASSVGTLILEDCTYQTLNSAASKTLVANKGGPLALPAPGAAKSANYAQTVNDATLIFAGTASLTLTLLNATAFPGRMLRVVNQGSFPVVSASANVVPLAGGAPGAAILPGRAGQWADLQSTGSNWRIVASNA